MIAPNSRALVCPGFAGRAGASLCRHAQISHPFGEHRSALRVFLGAVDVKLVATHAEASLQDLASSLPRSSSSSQCDRG
jgi:hypothetical protein